LTIKWFINLVFPGFEEVCANLLWLHNILIKEDLPTFDLPTNANSGNLGSGLSSTLTELPENMTLEIFITTFEQQRYNFITYICINRDKNR